MSARDTFDCRSFSLSRRAFIERAGLLTGGLLVLGPGGLLRAGGAQAQTKTLARAFTAGSFMLTLEGDGAVGFVQSFEGGSARGEVVANAPGPAKQVQKNIGAVRYDPIRFRAPIGSMAPPLWALLNNTLKGSSPRVNGEIAVADFNGTVQRSVVFTNALVSELSIPALDGASKETAYVEVALAPETTRTNEKPGGKVTADMVKGQKKSMLANFRLTIDGLDQACKRINKIEALVVKQNVQTDSIGIVREPTRLSGQLELPNLVFTVPMVDAPEFQKWHKEFVIDGLNTEDKERGGSIDFLGPDMATVLLTVKFSNLGIFALAPVAAAASSDAVASMKAELYCESMSLEVPKTAEVSCMSSGISRRGFLGRAGIWTAGLAALGPAGLLRAGSAAAQDAPKPLTGGYVLKLDGELVGPLRAFEGPAQEVQPGVFLPSDRSREVKLRADVDGGSRKLFELIEETLSYRSHGVRLEVIVLDSGGSPVGVREFQRALISEVRFPALDSSSKDPMYVEVKLLIERAPVSGAAPAKLGPLPPKRTPAVQANFALEIQGLEEACASVQRIEPLTLKQQIQAIQRGSEPPELVATKLEIPDLTISLPLGHAKPFYDWYESFINDTRAGDSKERSGTLRMLGADSKTTLLELGLTNLGMYAISESGTTAKVQMYCEGLHLELPPG